MKNSYVFCGLLLLIFIIIIATSPYVLSLFKKKKTKASSKVSSKRRSFTTKNKQIAKKVAIREGELQKENDKAIENPPEIERLAKYTTEFMESLDNDVDDDSCVNQKWDLLIAIGDIYARGGYPRFRNNRNVAAAIYKVTAMCPDSETAGIAQYKYVELLLRENDFGDPNDNAGIELPVDFAEAVCTEAETKIMNLASDNQRVFERPVDYHNKRRNKTANANTNANTNANANENNNNGYIDDYININDNDDDMMLMLIHDQQEEEQQEEQRVHRAAPPADLYEDAQNVHDHSVTGTTKTNIINLKKELTEPNNYHKTKALIKKFIQKVEKMNDDNVLPRVRIDALTVIKNLDDINKHSTYGITEVEALSLVLQYIEDNITLTKSEKENLWENLVKQLASAIEHGSIVCSSGKIARIISALDGSNVDNYTIKPMWAVRDEIGNLAANVRNEAINKEKTTEEAREQLRQIAHEEYVNKLHMSPAIIGPLVEEYCNEIDI